MEQIVTTFSSWLIDFVRGISSVGNWLVTPSVLGYAPIYFIGVSGLCFVVACLIRKLVLI